ncbi:MAG: hypothetical protein AAF533_01655 [Acidobacteriota bacterium]
MKKLSAAEVVELTRRHELSVIHFDCDWDGYRLELGALLRELEARFQGEVGFGYVDPDQETEYCAQVQLLNVPAVGYYRGTELQTIVIGKEQDVAGNIDRLRAGRPIVVA